MLRRNLNNSFSDEEIFKKFSDSARKILTQSQRIARDMGSGINSEHILLALTTSPGTIAYEILHDHLINIDQIRLILSLRGRETTLQTGISPFAKHIIELAAQSAVEFGHLRIDAEHLLLGIASYPECLAYQIITRIGIDAKSIHDQITHLFDELANLDTVHEQIHANANDFFPKKTTTEKNKNIKTPSLDYFGSNLTILAKQGKLDPVIGRGLEINRVIQILARRTKNNPVLVGDPGVGKTAIVEGLAQMISNNDVPAILHNKQLIQIDLALLIAGTTFRGQFEERLKKIMQEAKRNLNIILFIDEIHTIVGAGSAEGTMDAANILKPVLAKGDIRLIGATTNDEFRKYIEKDSALERRLQKVLITEPSIEESIDILKGLKKTYEKFHNVKITDDSISTAVILSQRFIQDRFLPDKAIDLIDEAASAIQIKKTPISDQSINWEEEIEIVSAQKDDALISGNFELAAKLREKELKLLTSKPKKDKISIAGTVTGDDIASIVSSWTKIPVGRVLKEEQERLRNLEITLQQQIIGQDEAVKAISLAIRRSKAGISNPNKPLGSFIFMGPTGVGKTYLTQVLAKTIYGNENSLIKIDMSEFMEKHNISRLIGAPPGYVGYENAGKLTESIRRQPFSVVLFDEIEKAHPDVFNILLQILEDGNLTDASGRQVSFRHSIIVMTSNIGSNRLIGQEAIGFKSLNKHSINQQYESLKTNLTKELNDYFLPEILNRIDKVIIFSPLNKKSIEKIVDNHILELQKRLKEEKYHLLVDNRAKQIISEKGFDPNYGARPLRRAITELLEDPLADILLSGEINKGSKITVSAKFGKIVINNKSLQYASKIKSPA